jgi:hypothetical protein
MRATSLGRSSHMLRAPVFPLPQPRQVVLLISNLRLRCNPAAYLWVRSALRGSRIRAPSAGAAPKGHHNNEFVCDPAVYQPGCNEAALLPKVTAPVDSPG